MKNAHLPPATPLRLLGGAPLPSQAFAEVCALCSDSHVEAKGGVFRAIGQPTEAALLVLAEKLGVPEAAEQQRILQERRENPGAQPTGACAHYAGRCAAVDLAKAGAWRGHGAGQWRLGGGRMRSWCPPGAPRPALQPPP